jgi:protein-tyrosine phosphatase
MVSDIHWITAPIPGRLAVMPRPRAGQMLEDEIAGWTREGIHFVVSLLEPQENLKLDLSKEAFLCQRFSLGFISYPFPDRGVPPSVPETPALVQSLKAHLQNRKAVAIHCTNGIGRSAVIAACVLVSFGIDPKRALELVAKARGFMVPDTNEQRNWVAEFAQASASPPAP